MRFSLYGRICTMFKDILQGRDVMRTSFVSIYTEDIFQTLKEAELKRTRVRFFSQQTQFRPALLQLLRNITEKSNLNRCTLHLAVYLLDRFTDSFTIKVDKLNLTALTCLHIAAQIEDCDPHLPKYIELNRLVDFSYHWHEYKSVERKILMAMDFGLLRPTTAHFAEHLAGSLLTEEDYQQYNKTAGKSYESYETMLTAHIRVLLEFTDLTLSSHQLTNTRPSVLCASCIACVRMKESLHPRWTQRLERLTTYNEETIAPIVELLNTMYAVHKRKQHTNSYIDQMQPDALISTKALEFEREKIEWCTSDSGIQSDLSPASTAETNKATETSNNVLHNASLVNTADIKVVIVDCGEAAADAPTTSVSSLPVANLANAHGLKNVRCLDEFNYDKPAKRSKFETSPDA